jgi:uncharacterized protein YbbC (DUF1343 family)
MAQPPSKTVSKPVRTGLENFLETPPDWILGRKLGLLCNPASVNADFEHASRLIQKRLPGQLVALFSPQHGFHADKQDNMHESPDALDPASGLPVRSLYSHTRIPTAEMLDPIDVLVVDLQDVGTRVYTFLTTLSYCLEQAARQRKKVLVLDRPNPINGRTREGNCLRSEWTSFVGRYPIPMRHGLTIGEAARLFNRRFGIDCELEVLPMSGWQRGMWFGDTGLPWVPPSPNLPTPASVLVYPGQVVWEGTNVSEGRGTTLPFELFGAPFIEPDKIMGALPLEEMPGIALRPTVFEPTANKWNGQPCWGFQIHVTDPVRFQPYGTTLRLLQAVMHRHPDHFQWLPPPYEYEFERMPIDLILGDGDLRRELERGESIPRLEAQWQADLTTYEHITREFLIY